MVKGFLKTVIVASTLLITLNGMNQYSKAMTPDDDPSLTKTSAKLAIIWHRDKAERFPSCLGPTPNAHTMGIYHVLFYTQKTFQHKLHEFNGSKTSMATSTDPISYCNTCQNAKKFLDEYDTFKKTKKKVDAATKPIRPSRIPPLPPCVPSSSTHPTVHSSFSEEAKRNDELLIDSLLKENNSLRKFEEENSGLQELVKRLQEENSALHRKLIPPQTIPEDQVAEFCVTVLLKKDPQIFCPWVLNKKITGMMETDFSSDKNSFPSHIVVEGGAGLSAYVQENLELELGNEIIQKGR